MVSSYIAVDLETTGLDPKQDKIIEIGAVKVVEGAGKRALRNLCQPLQEAGVPGDHSYGHQ